MTVSTDELIRRYQAGQTGLFEALFERYKDYVYRVAYSMTRHPEEAQEVVQETFLDVLRALPRYQVDGPARFETWLYRVTANRCKMRWRRKRPLLEDWDEVGERLAQVPDERPDHDPEAAVQQAETRRRVWQAVGRLKEVYRTVIVLRYGQDMSYAEIAAALEVSIGTVKSRLYTAHCQLQELLEGGSGGGRGAGRKGRGGPLSVLLWIGLRLLQAMAEGPTSGSYEKRKARVSCAAWA
jgi:RNA polymerase sigma-70 factor (ECF subfamily)